MFFFNKNYLNSAYLFSFKIYFNMTHLHMLSSKYDYVPQWCVEDSIGSPIASPTMQIAGFGGSIQDVVEATITDYFVFSKYNPAAWSGNGITKRFTITYSPFDLELVKRHLLAPNGAGTLDESITFIERARVGGTQKYKERKGSVCLQQTGQINRAGGFVVTDVMECQSVSDWIANHTLSGTPVFVTKGSLPTDPPINHMTGGTTPCTVNGTNTRIQDFRWDQGIDIAKLDPNGTLTFEDSEIAGLTTNITLTSWVKDNVLENYVENNTEVDIVYKLLDDPTNNAIKFPRVLLKRHETSAQANGKTYIPETITGTVYGDISIVTV